MSAAPEFEATIADGRLHLPARTHAQALEGCPAVALLADGRHWWLLPLHAGAGGLQVKQRNAAGDRVVEAREFLRAQGVGDAAAPIALTLRFAPQRGGFQLVIAEASPEPVNAAGNCRAHGSEGPLPL